MTPCVGQPGHRQCNSCVRRAVTAIMRPVVKLTSCAMYEPKEKRKPAPVRIAYAGKVRR
jgi:hypothetical protein